MDDPETETPSGECLNCGTLVGGRYCAHCGQKVDTARLRLRTWISEAIDLSVSLETRMWATLVGLTIRPGETVLRYLRGQRIRFTNPLRYAVLAAGVWMLGASLVNEASVLMSFLSIYGQLLNLLLIPVLAVVVHLCFRGSSFTYAEHLCLCLYMFGHVFVYRALLAVAGGLGAPADVLTMVDLILLTIYSGWMLWSFHSGRVRLIWLRILGFYVGLLMSAFVLEVTLLIIKKIQARS